LNWLAYPHQLDQMRTNLQAVRGEAGAAARLAQIAMEAVAVPAHKAKNPSPQIHDPKIEKDL
jgi:hypothetical protein